MAPTSRTLRILIVDDQVDFATGLSHILRIHGAEVSSCHDGVSALDSLKAALPDVVLLDLGLPRIDGYEVARRIRELPGGREVRIVALSGFGLEDLKGSVEDGLFDREFLKPIDFKGLIAYLDEQR